MVEKLNGVDLAGLDELVKAASTVGADTEAAFGVTTRWAGQMRSVAKVSDYRLGGKSQTRYHTVIADEPTELGGQDSGANPIELLISGLNACLIIAYVIAASSKDITLNALEIQTEGSLDVRGFLGIDPNVPISLSGIRYVVKIDCDASDEQLEEIQGLVQKSSVNLANLTCGVPITSDLCRIVAKNSAS